MSSSIDSVLAKNANDLAKQLEVERIMKSFKLNPYDILDLPFGATEAEVKKQYRKKSLMIHPDKYKHENGMEAFDFLKKAEGQLSDSTARVEIDAIMTHSRTLVLKSLQGLKPPFDLQVRNKAKEVLVEDELARRRKQKLMYANEGAEKAKQEEEVAKRKRKVEDQAAWEAGSAALAIPLIRNIIKRREERITSWRDFNTKKPKKKKGNEHVLG